MTITQSSTRFVALTLGVAAVAALAFSMVLATPAYAAVCPGHVFSTNLKLGSTGAEVMALQQFLNMSASTQVAASGVGSPGSETSYFGGLTKAAVNKFQTVYMTQILTPLGLSTPTGNFASASRAQANAICSGTTGSTPGNTNPGVPVTGNGLKAVLSPDSPNNIALVQGQAAGTLAKFTFVNPTNASIMVSNLSFKRIGVSNDTTLTNVYLFSGAVRLTDSAGVSNSSFNFNNPSGLFTVAAGGTFTVSVVADIAGSTSGQQVGAQLVSVGATGTLDTGTTFPINSYTQTISAATLSTVDFGSSVTPAVGNVDPQADYTAWQNTVTVGTRAVWLKSFAVRNIGSIYPTDLRNFRLYVDGVKVGSAVSTMDSNSMITFDLSANPVNLNTGGRVIKIIADVVGGASRTFSLSLRYPSDAIFVDSNLGQPILPTNNGSAFSAVTTGVQTINSVTNSAPSVTKAADSPTSNVSVGATNVKWASFKVLASGEDVKIDNLNVKAVVSTGVGLQNGAVFFNGVQVGSTKNLTNATNINFTFGSSMIAKAGQTSTIDIYADAKSAAGANLANNATATTSLELSTNNGQGQVSLSSVSVPTGEVTGNTITVSSSALTGTKASGYGNQTVIGGSTAAKIGSFTLAAGSTEGVNVNTIDIGFAASMTTTLTNLTLKDASNGAMLGSAKTTVGATNSYSVNLPLASSGSKTIDIYADVKSGAGAGTFTPILKFDTAGTGASTGNSVAIGATSGSDINLQTMTYGTSGTLTASVAAGNPVSANVIAGNSAGVKVGQFTFAAQNSPFTVQQLNVQIPNGAATSVSGVTIKYKDSNGATQTASTPLSTPSTSQTYGTSTFTGLSLYVPSNDSADVEVWVTIPTTADGAVSGVGISAVLEHAGDFKAIDSAGNTSTSFGASDLDSAVTGGYGKMYVKKSFPTFAKATSGLSQNVTSGQPVYKFTLSADTNGAIDWNKISFTVSTTSVTASGMVLYDVTGGANNAVSASTEATAAGVVAITTNSTGNIQQIGAGQSKTYELRPTTVSGWGGAGDSLTVAPTVDSSPVVNAAVSSLSAQNFIWSDRSASNHSSQGTSATDWTNGYLVKDFTSTATYSCQFGTATTCQ